MSEIEYKPYKTMVMNRFGPNERESRIKSGEDPPVPRTGSYVIEVKSACISPSTYHLTTASQTYQAGVQLEIEITTLCGNWGHRGGRARNKQQQSRGQRKWGPPTTVHDENKRLDLLDGRQQGSISYNNLL
ncbi:hypothetical protein OUZ56_007474 [Daphnia magna]|uniref:Uncharacterized protein n=1 Tax=Daphnia magna TaxID=35525 RepID=A0ABR0AA25_9CRUS|nr:hypothetical protein OUZ56_007474 [Daphnia magna]